MSGWEIQPIQFFDHEKDTRAEAAGQIELAS